MNEDSIKRQIRSLKHLFIALCEEGGSDGETLFMNYLDAIGAIAISSATDHIKGGRRAGGYEGLYDKLRAAAAAISIRYPDVHGRSFVGDESKEALSLLIIEYAGLVQLGAQEFAFGRTG